MSAKRRRPASVDDTRDVAILIRVSDTERAELTAAADEASMPVSTWVRATAIREARKAARRAG